MHRAWCDCRAPFPLLSCVGCWGTLHDLKLQPPPIRNRWGRVARMGTAHSHAQRRKPGRAAGSRQDSEPSKLQRCRVCDPQKAKRPTDRPARKGQSQKRLTCRLGRSYAPLLAPSLSANTYRVHRDQVAAAQRTVTPSPSWSLGVFYLIRGEAPPPRRVQAG
jgi:hypothetical protein